MATWKKVIVSGSAVTQLDFTSSTVLSGSMASNLPSGVVSSSAQTIANLPDGVVSSSDQTIANLPGGVVSGSAQTIENLVGSTVLSGSITSILPSGVVSGSAQTIANLPDGVVSSSAQTIANLPAGSVSGSAQTIENLVGSTVLSGSITSILPSGVVSSSAQTIANLPGGVVSGSAQTIENLVGSTILSGSMASNLPSGVVSSSAQTIANLPGGVVSSSVQTIANLPGGVVSGSAQTIENLVGSTILSGSLPDDFIASVGNTTGQTGITLAVNAGALTATVAGLDTTDNVEFTNLTVSGDLAVAGTASFKHSQNLDVADQYITMNSGSGTGGANLDSGGIIVAQNDTLSGELFGWLDSTFDENGTRRWAVASGVPSNETGNFTAAAYMSAVLPRAAASTAANVLTLGGGTAGEGYNKVGNIFTGEDGDIWIYSDGSGA
jgi:phage-related protein